MICGDIYIGEKKHRNNCQQWLHLRTRPQETCPFYIILFLYSLCFVFWFFFNKLNYFYKLKEKFKLILSILSFSLLFYISFI